MIHISDILDKIPHKEFKGDKSTPVLTVIPFDPSNMLSEALMWVNDKNLPAANGLHHGILIASSLPEVTSPSCNYIIVEKPRDAFRLILSIFFDTAPVEGIASSAIIHPSAKIGEHVFIGEHVVIEENCVVGDHCVINHNTVLYKRTVLDENVTIGSNCTIGGVGFGYEKDVEGNYMLIPHIGGVLIKKQVEIGNNVCIDRGVLGNTVLEDNVKVDNLVHIAHGVHVKRNALLIANSMIGGSTTIGENVWVAPSATIINKCVIHDNALIGLGAVVVKSVNEGVVVVGNPAKPLIK